jgi:2-polyprenyl-3-methyl-5-hydroxy-6-metoxy-1,4-benzoquinol methylase
VYSQRLTAAVQLLHGHRVLHVGAAGNFRPPSAKRHFAQQALTDAGFSVVAADISQEGVEWLRSLKFESVVMDAEQIPPEGEVFDSVFAGELIEHLSNPGLFLDGVRRRLRPGGRLVLTTPQPFSPLHVALHALRPGAFNSEHACWFDEQTLSQLLARHCFRVVFLATVNDAEIEGWSRKSRLPLRLLASAPGRFGTTLVVAAEPVG